MAQGSLEADGAFHFRRPLLDVEDFLPARPPFGAAGAAMWSGVAGVPITGARPRVVLRPVQAYPCEIAAALQPLEISRNLPHVHAGRVKDRVNHEAHLVAGSLDRKGLKVEFLIPHRQSPFVHPDRVEMWRIVRLSTVPTTYSRGYANCHNQSVRNQTSVPPNCPQLGEAPGRDGTACGRNQRLDDRVARRTQDNRSLPCCG